MSFDILHKRSRFLQPGRKAVTLIEMLVAIAITGIFLSGVMEAFVYMIRTSDRAEIRLESVTNARTAMERMSAEIKTARIDPRRPIQFFHGLSTTLGYGDAMDNDHDGLVDEEVVNGADDDGDYSLAEDDLHVRFSVTEQERPELDNLPDLGDYNIDEDCRFSRDVLEFRTFPDPDNPGYREKNIKYEITTFDGVDNVLVRTVTYNPTDPDTTYEEFDPIAFNVLSLDFLYFDPNRIPMNWVEAWDSLYSPFFPDPAIELPVSVYIRVTVYAGMDPFDEYIPGEPVETVTLETVVNIEQVLKDARYQNLK